MQPFQILYVHNRRKYIECEFCGQRGNMNIFGRNGIHIIHLCDIDKS